MFSCCKKQKKINNGFDRKSSDGELIFEDIQKIRAIMIPYSAKVNPPP